MSVAVLLLIFINIPKRIKRKTLLRRRNANTDSSRYTLTPPLHKTAVVCSFLSHSVDFIHSLHFAFFCLLVSPPQPDQLLKLKLVCKIEYNRKYIGKVVRNK